MHLPVMMSKNTLRVVKSGIGFHNFMHNNIQILNFNFKILASHFFLLVECLKSMEGEIYIMKEHENVSINLAIFAINLCITL